MRILIDMDGVLADLESEFLTRWRERFPNETWVALADRQGFPLKLDYPEHLHDAIRAIIKEPGFYEALPPIEGGRSALEGMESTGVDVRICTSPLSDSRTCMQEKVDWVHKHLGPRWVNRMVITKDKTIVTGDILIDDRPEIVGEEPRPSWEHVYFDQPYNRDRPGRRRLTWKNWQVVLGLK